MEVTMLSLYKETSATSTAIAHALYISRKGCKQLWLYQYPYLWKI